MKRRSRQAAEPARGESEQAADPAPARDLLGGPAAPWDPPAGCVYRGLLSEVIDPELGVNIVDLGLVYDLRVAEGTAHLRMTMTTPGCPMTAYLDDAVRSALAGAPGVDTVEVDVVWDPPWGPAMLSERAKGFLGWRR